jgi:hypothetical protein
MDGLVDILIGCQPSKTINPEEQQNLAFRQRPDGSFEPMNGENYQDLRDDGAAMAFGIIDVDVDGLLDVVLVNDTFVESGTVANTLSTGGLLFRCPPSQGCIYERRQFAGGIKAWGSFMGVGNIEINGSEEHLYITDWGANRLLNFGDSRTPRDTALTYGVDLAYSQDLPLFAWSVVVDDFDRNGLDDMLVTQGDPSDIKHFTFEHRDVLFLQRGLGDFVEVGQEAGIGLPNHEDSLNPERVSSSRGAVKADLDGDGLLDIIAASLEGHLKIISELPTADNASDRCTLVPRGRVVPSYGFGYAVSPHWTRDFRRRDMQGNMRFGAGPFVLSSVSRGVLRFPSGAEVDFDCQGGPGPIVVEEPDWIEAWREEGVAFVRLEAPWLDGALSFEVALRRPGQEPARIDSDVSVMDGVLVVPLEEGEDGIMVKVNGLWVGRWWAL